MNGSAFIMDDFVGTHTMVSKEAMERAKRKTFPATCRKARVWRRTLWWGSGCRTSSIDKIVG